MNALSVEGRQEENPEPTEEDRVKLRNCNRAAKNGRAARRFRRENEELKSAGKKNDAAAFFGESCGTRASSHRRCFDRAVALDIKLGDDARKNLARPVRRASTVVDLTGAHAADKNRPEALSGGSARSLPRQGFPGGKEDRPLRGPRCRTLSRRNPNFCDEEERQH